MTTTWQILDTKSQIANGLITKVVYGCTVQLENDIDRKIGEVTLTGDASASNFIPFTSLTEKTVIGWVKTTLGGTEVIAIETEIEDRISARKIARDAETEKSGLPWRQ
jgi:hypothetical protein